MCSRDWGTIGEEDPLRTKEENGQKTEPDSGTTAPDSGTTARRGGTTAQGRPKPLWALPPVVLPPGTPAVLPLQDFSLKPAKPEMQ